MKPHSSSDPDKLRRTAEAQLKGRPAAKSLPADLELRRLHHELEIHQIELENQNTELRSSQAEVERGLELYADLYDLAPIGYLTLDHAGIIQLANLSGARLLGRDRAGLTRQGFSQFVAASDRRTFGDFLHKVFSGEAKESCEVALATPGLSVQIEARRTATGTECRMVLIDITARKQAESSLREEQMSLAALMENLPDQIYFKDRSSRFTRANSALVRVLGLNSAEEVLGKTDADFFAAEHALKAGRDEERIMRTGEPMTDIEEKEIWPDGSVTWVVTTKLPVRNAEGRVTGTCGISRDITARKQAELTLAHKEARLRRAEQVAGFGNWEIDLATQEVTASENARRIFGLGDKPLSVADVQAVPLAKFRPALDTALRELIEQGRPYDVEFQVQQSPDGPVGHIHSIAEYDPVSRKVFGVIHDITERVRSEATLRRQSNALHAAANVIVITDRDGIIEWANPAFAAISGYTLEEAIGKTPGQLFKSGVHSPAFYRQMWGTINAGKVWQGEMVNRRKNGTFYNEEITITPMKDDAGEITHYIAVKQNITQRKSLETQLFQSQKMEAVGLLAGGVAHDFNNILASVLIYLGMLQDEPALKRETLASLRELEKEVRRGASLTRQLLTFSRQQAMMTTTVNLNTVIGNMTKMLRRLLGEQIAIVHTAPESVMLADADEGMLEQVLINLSINARDAMLRGGTLNLSVNLVELTAETPVTHVEARPGRFLRLTVADTGCGMDATTVQRIFEPFFTTKEMGKGTGLGLAIVHGVVKQHRGWVEVESVLGQGTTFHVFLPASESSRAGGPEKIVPAKRSPVQGETILVVEDEIGVRTVLGVVLRQSGYTVLEASNGPQALGLWQQHRDQIKLLITDMIMPGGMDGQELVERIQEDRADLNAIVCTGYSQSVEAGQFQESRRITLLRKPFDMALILTTVRHALDQT